MALAGEAPARPPAPEECDHPSPVLGVMAHEFAHYEGAVGPEGVRRTVTYYGPVVGGLPIDAWHCEVCGLLRLGFPDGRTEERRLYPGSQPGLIAAPSPAAPEHIEYGLQARVSGLSLSTSLAQRFAAEAPVAVPALRMPQVTLPAWDAVTWLLVLGMSGITFLLFTLGLLAVYTYSTPAVVTPLAIITACGFVGLLLFALGVVAVRHFFPAEPLRPSIAETARVAPPMDAATRAAVTFMVLSIVGLFTAGILAVYTYSTPGAETPVVLLTVAFAVLAALIKLIDAVMRRYIPR